MGSPLQSDGEPGVTNDEICSTPESRRDNTDIIEAHIMSWMMDYTKAELFERGQDAGLGVFPLNTAADVYAEPQYRYREFFQNVEHPIAGTHEYPGISYKLSDHQSEIRHRAPLLGEHNSDVFCEELGRSPEDLVHLYQSGVI